MLISAQPQPTLGEAKNELVVNGGFETGDLRAWQAWGYVEPYIYPTHSGGYVVHVGTWDEEGTLSQTVTIPDGSVAEFSLWYATETGNYGTTRLDVRLISEGRTVASWKGIVDYRGRYSFEWRRIAHTLGQEFSGKQVTIEIKGHGDVSWYVPNGGRGAAHKLPAPGMSRVLYPHEFPNVGIVIYRYAYVDDVSLTYTKVAFRSSVAVSGLEGDGQIRLFVDGRLNTTLAGEASASLIFPMGTTHTLSFEPVSSRDGQRFICTPARVSVSDDGRIDVSCKREVLLRLESAMGEVRGAGWYSPGSRALISLSPQTVQADGLLGILGVRYRFAAWSDPRLPASSEIELQVEAPMSIRAEWAMDYSSATLPLGGVAIVVVVAAILLMRLRRRIQWKA